jgi:hypothetical protein
MEWNTTLHDTSVIRKDNYDDFNPSAWSNEYTPPSSSIVAAERRVYSQGGVLCLVTYKINVLGDIDLTLAQFCCIEMVSTWR